MVDRILLCQSDRNLGMVLSEYFETQGFRVDFVMTPEDALEKLCNAYPDVLVLDLDQEGKNIYSFIKRVRQINEEIPLLVLTERSDRDSILHAYQLGADDVLRKPFSMEILVTKIRAWRRRSWLKNIAGPKSFTLGSLYFDSVQQTLGDRRLSGRENELLLLLCRHMDEVVDRHEILRSIWQQDDYFASRSLSVFANHLRNYLRSEGYDILTLHGKGYKLTKIS